MGKESSGEETGSDRELDESHGFSQTREPAVKDKKRSPPSDRPPSAPHLGTHHSLAAEEQESPERVVQKEKLHAELKQVLSLKRSQLRETSKHTRTEMDSPPETSSKEEHPQKERPTSEVVEVIMETEAEAGASGYSVIGGGERGIFVNEVLRDSPAAKNLSLQKGDQLLSARVYFDNVRYEDALKILQCAEPYKISFFLKRTVAHNEDTVHPAATNVDLKGPKAKMQKMSVKSTKPFKAKKKRGGRFGLKRLKENKQARVGVEVDTDGSPDRLEQHPVDVEFSLPRLKLKKGDKTTAEGMGKAEGSAGPMGRKKSKIRFPRMRVKGGGVGVGHADTNVAAPHGEADVSGETGTGKGKGDGLRIVHPKTKKAKVEVTTSEDPQEIAVGLPSGKGGATGSAHDSGSGAKLRMPKLKLPKVRLSRQSDEIDGTANVEGPNQTKLKMPSVDVTSPRVEMTIPGDDEAQARQSGIKPTTTNIYVSQRDIDLHFPKVKGWIDLQDKKVGKNIKDTDIKCSTVHMQDVDLTTPTLTTHSGDEIDGTLLKGAKIKAPQLNVSFPKLPEGTGKVSLPSLDISLPNHPQVDISLQRGRPEGEAGYAAGSVTAGKLTMPTADVSLPSLSGEARLEGLNVKAEQSNMPSVDISLPLAKAGVDNDNGIPKGEGDHTVTKPSMGISPLKGKAEGDVGVDAKVKGEKIKLPGFEVSLQNITPEGEVNIKGPEVTGGQFHLPSMDIAISKGEAEGYGDTERHFKGGEFKLPKTDISLSKLPDIDMSAQKPDVSVGDVSMPSIDISMPKGIGEGSIDVSGKVRAGKFKTPSIDVSLPKRNTLEGGADAEGLGLKGGKISVPSIQVSTPKISMKSEVDASSKDSGFNMPSVGVSIPGIELPEGYISNDGPEIKGGNINMPKVNISHPNINTGGDADLKGDFKGPDMKAPTFNVSFPKSPEGEAKIDSKHGKIELPTIDLAPKKGKAEGNITIGTKAKGGKFKMPKVSMPKFKSSKGDLHVEGPELKGGEIDQPTTSMSVPEGGDGQVSVKAKGGKFKMPTFDICLPKVKSSEGDLDVEGPEIQGGKIQKLPKDISLPKGAVEGNIDVDVGAKGSDSKIKMPTFDASLPKVKTPEGKIDIKGPEMKSGKFGMPSVDLSLPKTTIGDDNVDSTAKRGKMKFDIEGPHIKGGKINMPSIDISLPKEKTTGNINVDAPSKDGKLKMPNFDVSLPNFNSSKGEVNIEGTKMTKGKLAISSVDMSLPKGKVEGDMDVDVDGKGGKFKMPTFDVSLPKFKSPEGKIDVKGTDLKGPELQMPSVDVSLPKGNIEGGLDVDVDGKGGKLKMPTFGASLPKITLPKVDIEGPDAKGGKFNMPSIDFSLSTGKAEGDVDIDGTSKGGKFKMPTFDVSLPKFKSPEGRIDAESHEVKGGNIHMPSVDVSLPKGKVKGDLDVDVDGKGGTFKMPTFDVSLPKFKSTEGKTDVEGPDLKGLELQMPSVDVSLPKGNIEGGLDVDSKGGKLKMPTFDVSLPKITMPRVDIEGPDAKGGKFNMPSTDFSLPTGKVGNVDATSKDGTFKMPTLDVSLPKFKSSAGKVDVEGPEIKGGAVNMPSVDISPPKGKVEGNVDVDVDVDIDSKGGKFKMPTFDLSFPKMKLPEGKVNIDRADLKGGKISMPALDIALPQGKSEGDIDFDATAKGGKFKMPSFDVSLPKLKSPEAKINIEGPDLKGVKLQMPSGDVSLPKGNVERDLDVDFNSKGGNLKMPTLDVSLPKVTMPKVDIEGPDAKGGKFNMPSIDFSLPTGKAEGDIDGISKGGKLKMPTFDVSLPKLKSPEGKIDVEGPEVTGGSIHMPSIDVSLPKGKVKGDLDVDVDGKGGKFKMPKFDVSLPKFKSPKGKINVEGPDLKGAKLKMPSVDMSLPKGKVEGDMDVDVDGKGGKFKRPTFDVSLPKFKSPEGKIDVKGPDLKGPELQMPSVDVSLPKGNIEGGLDVDVDGKGGKLKMPTFGASLPKITLPKVDLEGPDTKGGKFSMPTVDFSLSKGKAEGDVDVDGTSTGGKFKMPTFEVSLPKLKSPEGKIDVEGPEVTGGSIHMPSIDVSLPKGKVKGDLDVDVDGKGGKFKMPTFDVSLPKFKSPEGKIDVEGPDLKGPKLQMSSVDVSLPKGNIEGGLDVDVDGKGGKLKMPTFGASLPKITLPKVDLEGPDAKGGKFNMPTVDFSLSKGKAERDVDVDGTSKGGKFKMPTFEVSLPKFKSPEGKIDVEGPEVTGGSIHMPSIDVSLPKGKVKGDLDVDVDGKGGKFKMPTFDVSLPKFKSPEGKIDVEGPDLKGPELQMPSVDVSLPKGNIEGGLDVDSTGGKLKMPTFDASLPKITMPKVVMEGPDAKGGKFNMPTVDFPLSKGKAEGDVDVDGTSKGGKFKMPSLDVSLPKFKSSGKIDVKGPEIKGEAVDMPPVDGSLPKGKVEGDFDVDSKGGKSKMPTFGKVDIDRPDLKGGKISMPTLDISLPQGKSEGEIDFDATAKGGKFKMPTLNVSLPSMRSAEGKTETEGPDVKGVKLQMPSIDLSLSKGSGQGEIYADEKVKGGKIKKPVFDVSLPKIRTPGGGLEIDGQNNGGEMTDPSLEMSMSKGNLEGDLKAKGGRFKLPSVTISLPKVKKSQGNAKIKGPEVKDGNIGMSETDISLQTGDTRGNANLEGNTKGGKLKMPSFDMSLPKLKSPQGKADIKGPEVKGGELQMPLMDMSVQKGSVDTNVDVGAKGTGGKLMLPTCDVSLPGFKSTEGKIDIEGPNFKGGKIHMPSVDMSSPRVEGEVGVDIECKDKGGKLKMPTFEVSLPKLKPFEGKIDIEGPELKDGSFEISSTDILLPKGKMGGDIDVKATAKGGKFKMPTVDVSLPKFKSPEGEIDIKGPRLGGDLHMPSIDISLPKGKAETDLDVDIDGTGKGGKLKMPTFDVSLPKLKSPEGKIYIEGPGLKAEELEMPSCEGDVNVDINGKAKTGKFKMHTFDVSLPKFKTSEGKIDITGPEIKTETPQMPSVDIFSSKGTTEGGTGLDIEAKSKGGKLKMPTFDVSLPKFKSPDGKLEVEGSEGRRGEWEMPSMDISTPKGKIDGKVDLDGTTKEGKFQIPSLDVSLPKFNVPEGEVHIEGPNIKGGKISSSTDIKLPSGDPKGYTDMDIDDKGKMAKFKMPHLDVSLPKFKSPEGKLDIEGSDVRDGKMHMPSLDIELPKGTSEGEVNVNVGKGGKFKMPEMDTKLPSFHAHGGKIEGGKLHMPSTDISLPKGIAAKDTGVEVDGKMKGGKLKMPTVDINLPNFKTSDGKVDVEGPETKGGKFHMPSLDVSLPKGSVEGDLNVDGKGGKLRMPTLDLSLPKIKSPGEQVDVEGPELKDGKISMPSIDISWPKGKGGDVAVTSKGGKLKMATFDVSLPTIKSPDEKNKIEGPDVQGGRLEIPSVDISSPKSEIQGGIDVNTLTKGGKFKMPTVDISLPKLRTSGGEIDVKGPDIKGEVKIPSVGPKSQFGEAKLEGDSSAGFSLTPSKTTAEGVSSGNIKLPNVKLPTVNISAPKVDLDFGLQKSKETDREDIELLQAEEGRPSSGASFEVPDVTVKMPKFSLPKISGKSSGGDVDLDMCSKAPEIDLKGKSSQKDVDQNIKIKGKKKKHKIKIPFFGTPKKDMELNISRGDRKEKELDIKMPSVEISLPATKTPEHEVLLPKTEVDVSEADIRAYEGSLKIPKMPSIGISVPKVDLDVSLPTLKHGAPSEQAKMEDEKKSNKGKTHLPTIDISVPKGNLGDAETEKLGEGGKIKIPDVRMPTIDISLPKGKSSTMGKTELEPEEGSGKFKLPQVNMPSFDVSNPKIKGPDVNVSDSKEGGGNTKMPSVKIPTIDIEKKKDCKKIELPDIDLNPSMPKSKVKGPKVKGTKFKIGMPKMKNNSSGIDVKPEGEEEGVTGRFKVQKTKIGKDSNPDLETDIKGQGNKGSLTISEPSIVTPGSSHDINMPRIPELDFDIGVSSGIAGGFEKDKSKGGKINLSKSGINVKGMSKSDVEMDYEGPKMPKVTKAVFVLVNPAESTGVTKNLSNEEHGMNAEGGLIKVPMTEMKAGTGKFHSKGKEGEEYCDEEGDGKSKAGKLKIPKVGFSPGKSGSFDVRLKSTDSGREEVAGLNGEKDSSKYVKLKMPKIEFTSPYSKSTPEEERLDSNAKLSKTESDQDVKGKKSKSGKIMFSGFKSKTEKTEGDEGTVVCSTARTEMLTERESSESPPMMYSTGVTSVRQREHESSMSYSTEPMLFEREGPSWRDIPRLTLTSQSGGLLQITPEGSPHGIRSSLQHSGDEASGGFQTPSPRMQMTSQGRHKEERIITTTSRSSPQQFGAEVLGGFHVGMKLKEEVIVTTTKEEIVTVVTKTSKHDVTDTPEESSTEKKSISPKPWEF